MLGTKLIIKKGAGLKRFELFLILKILNLSIIRTVYADWEFEM